MKINYLLIALFVFSGIPQIMNSQNFTKPKAYKLDLNKTGLPKMSKDGITAVTVSKDDRSRDIIPANNSERFKIIIDIEKDANSFQLKGEVFEYGIHKDGIVRDGIATRYNLKKSEQIFFELVPDVSKVNRLTLFTYCSGMICFNYMNCSEDKCIKYTIFERSTKMSMDTVPLMLLYVDNKKNNQVEKLVNTYVKDNKLTSIPAKYKKLLKALSQCMLVYYKID